MLQHQGHITSQGVISGTVLPNAKTSCQPGDICATKTVKGKGCFYVNYMNGSNGGTPLTIDVTETNSSSTYIYWVNTYNQAISIKGNAQANFYCYY